jgi:hypothetical protein
MGSRLFSFVAAHIPIIGIDVWEHVRFISWFIVVASSKLFFVYRLFTCRQADIITDLIDADLFRK